MILKANTHKKGSAAELARYLHGAGNANEHQYVSPSGETRKGGIVLDSNLLAANGAVHGKSWAAQLQAFNDQRKDLKTANIIHYSLTAEAGEHLTDEQWVEFGKTFLEEAGMRDHPFVIVQHGKNAAGHEHIHIATSSISMWGVNHNKASNFAMLHNARKRAEESCGLQVRETAHEARRAKKVQPKAELYQIDRVNRLLTKKQITNLKKIRNQKGNLQQKIDNTLDFNKQNLKSGNQWAEAKCLEITEKYQKAKSIKQQELLSKRLVGVLHKAKKLSIQKKEPLTELLLQFVEIMNLKAEFTEMDREIERVAREKAALAAQIAQSQAQTAHVPVSNSFSNGGQAAAFKPITQNPIPPNTPPTRGMGR